MLSDRDFQWVIRDRDEAGSRSGNVSYPPKAEVKIRLGLRANESTP